MANEQPWGRIGWLTLSTLDDARNSTMTGTTLNGPLGSGQFYWVYPSTLASLQVRLGSSLAGVGSTAVAFGILQNKPGPGEAADVVVHGVSKVIAASTSIVNGSLLQASSAPTGQGGEVNAWTTGNTGAPIGMALEAPASSGAVFTALIGSFAHTT